MMCLALLDYYLDIIGLSCLTVFGVLQHTEWFDMYHPSSHWDVKNELPNRWRQKQLLENGSSTQQLQSLNQWARSSVIQPVHLHTLMDADQPKTTKNSVHDDFIIIINHISTYNLS